jgi:calcineurin-like phosphoesterase family protein
VRAAAALLLAWATLPAVAQPPPTVVVAAAGDIACDPADPSYNGGAGTATACRMKATSDLLVGGGFDAVLLLGDNQYEDGALSRYQASYDPTWGRVKGLTRPAVGNHEYGTAGAAGYFTYFGSVAGDPTRGYYSFDLGAWHLIVLNSNCAQVGGCGPGSPQEQWLAADLGAHPGRCTLAYWHHPRFSSGQHGSDPTYQTFWEDLYAAGADLVLNGHDHIYERFAPQDPAGAADPLRGVREFVVGTGGKNQTPFATVQPNSVARSSGVFGVLALTLYPTGYDWRFLSAAGGTGTFADAGTGLCHIALPAGPASFHTLSPCRLLDTRAADAPALAGNTTRLFPAAGRCGVPATAIAVAANLTVVNASAGGDLRLFPAGAPPPPTSAINFARSQTRTNNAILALGAGGRLAAWCDLAAGATGTVQLVVDVTGYFE